VACSRRVFQIMFQIINLKFSTYLKEIQDSDLAHLLGYGSRVKNFMRFCHL
jgi:hypothetical protein